MAYRTLITTDALGAHLTDPEYAIVDCRFDLADPTWGEREYELAHIPGAGYAHLDRDLSGPKTGVNGRHPMPDPVALARLFGRLGISRGIQVVAYDQDSGMYASRLWWLLRWLGHDAVAVLDGGFAKWTTDGRPTASGRERRQERRFTGTPKSEMAVEASDVAQILHNPAWRLLDARAPERFRGDVEPIDKVPGHIPGAANHFFKTNVVDAGTFKSPDDLRASLTASIGSAPADHVVCYCGSGVTACHNLLALEHAGLHGAKLYPGSWSEWSADPRRPIERGSSSG
jgi:thiosulfate/3-mercaptopyruvate sulfurtransferase